MKRQSLALALAAGLLAMGINSAAQQVLPNPVPIPNQQDARPVPLFTGSAAVAKPIDTRSVPQNPWMAPNPDSNGHDDSYMSDTYERPGPLGTSPRVRSAWLATLVGDPRFYPPTDPVAIPVIVAFDREGYIVAGVIKIRSAEGAAYVQLTLIHPESLATLATFDLPAETVVSGGFRPAGAYFYLDDEDRVVVGTKDNELWRVGHARDASGTWSFNHDPEDTFSLAPAISAGDKLEAVVPDWEGRLWFTTKRGVVGLVDATSGEVRYTDQLRQAGERIVNSHAIDEDGGVYVVSTQAMYRFDAEADGIPQVTWRESYDAGTHVKEGQVDIGSGTTPTLMGEDYVAITDNGQPRMHVLVFRRARETTAPRLVCAQPVFQPGNASNENSLIATDRSIVVENNFGYKSPEKDTTHGRTTKAGMARVDVGENETCRTVWSNETISIPSVISKMSLANGIIYTYTKSKGPATTDAWYFTAVDFRTGEVVYHRLAGTGILYNNHYAGAYLGPDGGLYVGVLGGLVAMWDAEE
jgi:hypothetical protein